MPSRLGLLLSLALFCLNASAYFVGTWALDNFSVTCPDKSSCFYSFQIIEGVDGPLEGWMTTECTFNISAQGDVPAYGVDMTAQPCDGSDQYLINGGWDPHRFITLCISRASEDAWAFFGYDDYQIINANATWMNAQPAYEIGTFNATDRPPSGVKRQLWRSVKDGQAVSARRGQSERRLSVPTTDDNEVWTLNDVDHYVDTVHNLFHLEFTVAVGTSSEPKSTCDITLGFPHGRDAMDYNITNAPCSLMGGGYYVSWYPSPANDSALMTLLNPNQTLRAAFDFTHVSSPGPQLRTWASPVSAQHV